MQEFDLIVVMAQVVELNKLRKIKLPLKNATHNAARLPFIRVVSVPKQGKVSKIVCFLGRLKQTLNRTVKRATQRQHDWTFDCIFLIVLDSLKV